MLIGRGWRFLGALASWFLFVLCFSVLYRGASTVMGLGGFCASGGPYELAVECPPEVVATVPLSIFGGLGAAIIALAFARGFAAPLLAWAWPILFTGLGVAFAIAAFTTPGWVTNGLIAVMFVIMGIGPLVLALRANPRTLVLGSTRADDTPFAARDDIAKTYLPGLNRPLSATGDPVAPTALDWVQALAFPLVGIAGGLWAADAIARAITAAATAA